MLFSHSFKCKLLYACYTPFQNIKLRILGAKSDGVVFTAGNLHLERHRRASIKIGHNCRFMSKQWGNKIGLFHNCMLSVDDNASLTIGNRCSFSGVSIWCFDCITIGNNVRIGANVLIMDGDAHQDDPRAGANSPIIIEDNVWIGGGSTILKGVTIGRNSIIGAGSIVTKDIPENAVAVGNPCRVIRIFTESKINEIESFFR